MSAQELPFCPVKPCPAGSWTKLGPVLPEGHRARDRFYQNFQSPAEPLRGGRWRVWGSVRASDGSRTVGYLEGVPGRDMDLVVAELSAGVPPEATLSIGDLPVSWEPVQPVHLELPDGRHRLYFWAHQPDQGVQRFLCAQSDDGRHYRVVSPDEPVLYSFWEKKIDDVPSALQVNDSTSIRLLDDGTYAIYTQTLLEIPEHEWPRYAVHDNLNGYQRVIDRLASEDGLHFSERKRILQPDACDEPDLQFYHLMVTPTEQGYVGMLGHYRVQTQETDLEWCYSEDGIEWVRSCRDPWLERGRPFKPDCYAIYPAHGLVHHQGRWWLFYTGTNYAHNHMHRYGEAESTIMWATTDTIWGA